MIIYEKKIRFDGDAVSAMEKAKNFFMMHGFKLAIKEENTLLITGRGMISNRENAIKGLTKGQLRITEFFIEFKGELGGVQFMKKFLYLFPPVLMLILIMIFSIIALFTNQFSIGILAPILAIAPWLIISPIFAKSIQRKTEESINILLLNLSM